MLTIIYKGRLQSVSNVGERNNLGGVSCTISRGLQGMSSAWPVEAWHHGARVAGGGGAPAPPGGRALS